MSLSATTSGHALEKTVLSLISQYSTVMSNKIYQKSTNITGVTVPQYTFTDIFSIKARADFLYISNQGNKFFIECKNQKVIGSVDLKFPYYIKNMESNIYGDSSFVFILNTLGIRKKVLSWLVEQSKVHKFYILSEQRLELLHKILNRDPKDPSISEFVFI